MRPSHALVALGVASAHAKPHAALMPFWSDAAKPPAKEATSEASGACIGVACDNDHDDSYHHKHTLDDGHNHKPPEQGSDPAGKFDTYGPVKAFNMVAVDNCTKCGIDWCKTTASGNPDCITFTLNDTVYSIGGRAVRNKVKLDDVGCDALASAIPYCLDGGPGIWAVAKRSSLPAGFTEAPRVPEETWPTVERLNHMFEYGRPSNDLSEVGLIVHCVDGTERVGEPWLPCESGSCSQFTTGWWSGSIISRALPVPFGGKCILLHAARNKLLCAFPWDEGTMTTGCAVESNRYESNEIAKMMNVTFPSAYNEVLIDSPHYIHQQATAIAGFVFGLIPGSKEQDSKWAHWAYSVFVRAYGLENAGNRPLLLQGNLSAEPGEVFTDVSTGVKDFMRDTPLTRFTPTKWNGHRFRRGAKAPGAALRAEREDRTRQLEEQWIFDGMPRGASNRTDGPKISRTDRQTDRDTSGLSKKEKQEERKWERSGTEQEQEEWETKRNGTEWHEPKSTDDCEIGAIGELGAACRYPGKPSKPPEKPPVAKGVPCPAHPAWRTPC